MKQIQQIQMWQQMQKDHAVRPPQHPPAMVGHNTPQQIHQEIRNNSPTFTPNRNGVIR